MPFQEQDTARFRRRDSLKVVALGAAASIGLPYIVPAAALGKAGRVAASNRSTAKGKRTRRKAKPKSSRRK